MMVDTGETELFNLCLNHTLLAVEQSQFIEWLFTDWLSQSLQFLWRCDHILYNNEGYNAHRPRHHHVREHGARHVHDVSHQAREHHLGQEVRAVQGRHVCSHAPNCPTTSWYSVEEKRLKQQSVSWFVYVFFKRKQINYGTYVWGPSTIYNNFLAVTICIRYLI